MEPGPYGTYSKGYPEILARPPLPKYRRAVTPGPGANKRPRLCRGCDNIIPPTNTRGRPKLFCGQCPTVARHKQQR